MDPRLRRTIVRLANAQMPRPMECPLCKAARDKYQDDRKQEPVPDGYQNNPFGTLNGHIAAWKYVQAQALTMGGKITV